MTEKIINKAWKEISDEVGRHGNGPSVSSDDLSVEDIMDTNPVKPQVHSVSDTYLELEMNAFFGDDEDEFIDA
ncbi:unnamed protein product [Allacma fusca]|uniref:Uncharacterized protein n=1 Tax=Allacma fusca TaxID=39272 RepID=A0A8J2PBX6_9HEXA|nr:unnamed protein product [Allacma fusca]